MGDKKIQALIVDDSMVMRRFLAHLLESDSEIQVIGTVCDGQAALDFLANSRPDVVLMDIHMPVLDGFEATRRIMESQPVPIVICSATTNTKDVATTFRLLEAGALACVEKPVSREHADFEHVAANLLQTVKLMSEVKVVRRWPRSRAGQILTNGQPAELRLTPLFPQIIGIGASTGGPPVLQLILASLPKEFPVPILVVQHIARGFLPGLVEWLNQTTPLQVHVASYGASPQPGHAYLAPDDFHMGITAGGRILLTREEPESGLRPAVSYLFRSLSEACGPNAIGVLLTGMGRDGASELKRMKDLGAITIAQDRESSVVFGMPGEAIALGGATHVLPADKIAETIITLAKRKPASGGIEQ